MFRAIWFFGCLAVAIMLAVIGKSLVPLLTSEISPDGISHGIYDLLSRSSSVRTGLVFSLFIVFFTILGLGGQVLVDALTMRRFHQRLMERSSETPITHIDFMKLASDAGDFAETAEAYADHRTSAEQEALKTKLPAAQIFDEQSQIRNRLNLWLFDNSLVFSLSLGAILFLLARVIGVDDVVFQSQLSLRTPVNGLLPALQAGLFALALLAMAGLFARIVTGFMVDLRRSQLARFTSLLDGLFFTGQSALDAVAKPLKTLSDAQALMAEDRSEQLSETMAAALKDFRDSLTGEFTKQVKSTRKLMEETEKQVNNSTVAVEAAHDALAKYARGQSAAIDKAIAAAINNYFKDETTTRAGLNKAITDSLEAAADTIKQTSESSMQSLQAGLDQVNASYGGGLTKTADALKQTQLEMSLLVRAIERLASSAPDPSQTQDFPRLVNDDDFADAPRPLEPLSVEEAPSEEDNARIAQLTDALRGKAKSTRMKQGGQQPAETLSNKLKDLKAELGPEDLPEL
ncbi:MAG: hypothetical protein AAF337_11080 [Pseudomonadota bacterium]